jgi:hypothetical protein
MFIKTLLASALFVNLASAAVSAVVSTWPTHKHAICDDTFRITATHGTAVTSSSSNTISYKVPAPGKMDGVAFVSAPTEITHWKWAGAASADANAACTAAAAVTSDSAATMSYASGVFTIANVAVTATKSSCLLIYKVCVKDMAIHLVTDNQVKQSETDTTYVDSTATPAYSVVLGSLVQTYTPTAPVVGSKTGQIQVTFTSATTVATSKYFTLKVPGMLQYKGGQCWFGTDTTKTTALTADSTTTGYINFQPVVASGTSATKVTCDKVGYAATQASTKGSIVWGDSITAVTEGNVFSTVATKTAAPTAAFSAAPAPAGGSIAALVLGFFAALCLLF